MSAESNDIKHLSPRLRHQLKELRVAASLSQRQLGAIIGLGNAAISMIENGSRDTGTSTVEAWASACGGLLQVVHSGDDTVYVGDLDDEARRLVAELVAILPSLDPALRRTIQVLVASWKGVDR
jgi:transcriptional regulator with XRE-family HTH domain